MQSLIFFLPCSLAILILSCAPTALSPWLAFYISLRHFHVCPSWNILGIWGYLGDIQYLGISWPIYISLCSSHVWPSWNILGAHSESYGPHLRNDTKQREKRQVNPAIWVAEPFLQLKPNRKCEQLHVFPSHQSNSFLSTWFLKELSW